MFGLGIGELSIILLIVIVVFGATRLPMIGSGLGKGIKNFRSEVKTDKNSYLLQTSYRHNETSTLYRLNRTQIQSSKSFFFKFKKFTPK